MPTTYKDWIRHKKDKDWEQNPNLLQGWQGPICWSHCLLPSSVQVNGKLASVECLALKPRHPEGGWAPFTAASVLHGTPASVFATILIALAEMILHKHCPNSSPIPDPPRVCFLISYQHVFTIFPNLLCENTAFKCLFFLTVFTQSDAIATAVTMGLSSNAPPRPSSLIPFQCSPSPDSVTLTDFHFSVICLCWSVL